MGDLTLVVTELSSSEGKQLIELASEWAQFGVVKESIWIDRTAWSPDADAPGFVVDVDGVRAVAVMAELARRKITTLRLVSLHLVGDQDAHDRLPTGAEQWEIHRKYWMGAANAGIPFKSGIMAAAAAGCHVPIDIFHPQCDFNLLLSSEDRIGDNHMGEDVVATALDAHALAALTIVGGLATWAVESPIDGHSVGQGNVPMVQVARAFVRIIDGGGFADLVVGSVLDLEEGGDRWPLPAGLSPPGVSETDPAATSSSVARQLEAAFNLRFEPFTSAGPPGQVRLGLWKGLKLFYKTFWKVFSNAPSYFVRYVHERVEAEVLGWFQSHTFGPDSHVQLTLRGRDFKGGDGSTASTYHVIRDLGMPGTDAIVAEPALWQGLRATACGLMDGSDLATGVQPPVSGAARMVLSRPVEVAPLPGDAGVFVAPEVGARIGSCDPVSAELLRSYLETESGGSQVVDVPPSDSPSEKSADGSAALRAPVERLAPPVASAVLARLNGWLALDGRETSLLWLVGRTLGRGLGDASKELAEALGVINEGDPGMVEANDEREARRRFRRYLVVSCIVLAAAVTGVTAAVVAWDAPDREAVGLGLVLFIIWHAVVLNQFMKYVAEQTRMQFRRLVALHRYYEAFSRAHVAAVGITRFSSLYWQYLDWAETVAAVLHRPWGAGPERHEDVGLDGLRRPLSVGVARAEVSPDRFQRRVAAAQDHVMTVGWLRSAFDDTVRRSSERHALLTNAPESDKPDPYYDVAPMDSSLGRHAITREEMMALRSQIRLDAVNAKFSKELRDEQATEIIEQLLEDPIEDVFSHVAVGGATRRAFSGIAPHEFLYQISSGKDRPPAAFPLGMFTDTGRPHLPQTSFVALPATVGVGKSVDHRTDTRTHVEFGRRLLIGSHRLDLSEQYSAPGIAMLTGLRVEIRAGSEVAEPIRE